MWTFPPANFDLGIPLAVICAFTVVAVFTFTSIWVIIRMMWSRILEHLFMSLCLAYSLSYLIRTLLWNPLCVYGYTRSFILVDCWGRPTFSGWLSLLALISMGLILSVRHVSALASHLRKSRKSYPDLTDEVPMPSSVQYTRRSCRRLRRDAGPIFGEEIAPEPQILTHPPGSEMQTPGSSYVSMELPPWSTSIWRKVGDRYALVGHANRIHNCLVTAWHILCERPEELYVLTVDQGVERVLPITKFDWQTVTGDICAAPIGKNHMPGLRNASIKHVEGAQMVAIATDFPANNASTGLLRNSEVWGGVRYDGAVRQGFSGASYFHGKHMYGIHVQGGSMGAFGYSASYVANLMKSWQSSDYAALVHMLETSYDRRYRSRRVDPDTVEVEFSGRYFRIEVEEAQELYEEYPEYWGDEEPPRERRQRRRRRRRSESDYSEASVEFQGATHPFEAMMAEPAPPVEVRPVTVEVAVQTDPENCSRAPPSGGSPLDAPPPTVSLPPFRNPAPSPASSQTRESSHGPTLHQEPLPAASQSTANTPGEPTRRRRRRPRRNSNSSMPRSRREMPSDTRQDTPSSQRQNARGERSSRPSTGRARPDLASSLIIVPTQMSSAGTASVLQTPPIMSSSRPQSPVDLTRWLRDSGITRMDLLHLAHAGVPDNVLNALRTLSTSLN